MKVFISEFIRLFLFLIFSSPFSLMYSQTLDNPKNEVRAVWLTTVDYLDWPKPEYHNNIETQKKSLTKILDYLKRINFNTIYFQVRPRGNAFFKSSYEPWAKELTGTLGKDPGYDPLVFFIEEAHKRGIEVHAWINVVKVWSGKIPPPRTIPEHIILKNPDWVKYNEKEWWLDMGIPECRDYLVDVVFEIAQKYDIDGIHFDYMRYPGKNFDDYSTYHKYADGLNHDDWRRNNITSFLNNIYKKVNKIKPFIKIGAAPVGIYKNVKGCSGWSAFSDVFQDCKRWVTDEIIDYLSPQIYWDLKATKSDPGFLACLKEWKKIISDKHLFPGIAAMREVVKNELTTQIITSRNEKTSGNVFYRYSDIVNEKLFIDVYKYPANIPQMTWKKSIQPEPPTRLIVDKIQNQNKLSWFPSNKNNSFSNNKFYNVYRSLDGKFNSNDSKYLLATVGANISEYVDYFSKKYIVPPVYYVSCVDKYDVESRLIGESILVADNDSFSNRVSKTTKKIMGSETNDTILNSSDKLQSIYELFRQKIFLVLYPDSFEDYSLIGYEVINQNFVEVSIFSSDGKEVVNVLKGIQNPGKYILKFYGKNIPKGIYMCRLQIGNLKTDKYITKK